MGKIKIIVFASSSADIPLKMRTYTIAIVLALAAAVSAHTCLFAPTQRLPMSGFDTSFADDCGLTTKDCGDRDPATPVVAFEAGSNQTFVWQKNVDHFTTAYPGTWVISYASDSTSGNFSQLYKATDTNTTDLTVYSANIVVPTEKAAHGVFQLQYQVSFGVFYQCADVAIV